MIRKNAPALAAVVGALLAGCVVTQPVRVDAPAAGESTRASLGGKYEVLLLTVTVPEDVRRYGELNDYGYWPGGTYAGVTGIPPGYWVYVAPTWYVWQRLAPGPAAQEAPPVPAGRGIRERPGGRRRPSSRRMSRTRSR